MIRRVTAQTTEVSGEINRWQQDWMTEVGHQRLAIIPTGQLGRRQEREKPNWELHRAAQDQALSTNYSRKGEEKQEYQHSITKITRRKEHTASHLISQYGEPSKRNMSRHYAAAAEPWSVVMKEAQRNGKITSGDEHEGTRDKLKSQLNIWQAGWTT